jgi:hypothetical protein
MPIADMDPSDAKLVSQARSAAAAKATSASAKQPAASANIASVVAQANALKAKMEAQVAALEKQQSAALVIQASAAGATGDYSKLNKIIKDPAAYQAFKDARSERITETRIANTPLKPSTTTVTPTSTGISYGGGGGSTPTPTPATPTTVSPAVAPVVVVPPVKTAPIDTVLFNDEQVPIEVMSDLIFEDIGGHELINIARNDIINGQDISYQPIKNLTSVQQQYNPNNILSVQSTSDKYFSNFAIKLENKTPNVGNGPFGSNVYLDTTTGALTIDSINLESDEQIEIEITTSGTIYEADLTGSES